MTVVVVAVVVVFSVVVAAVGCESRPVADRGAQSACSVGGRSLDTAHCTSSTATNQTRSRLTA